MSTKTRFSSLSAWLLSFFAPQLYRDVGANWRGVGLFYLFFLLAVCWIPLMYKYSHKITNVMDQVVAVVEQMPAMELKDGQFSIDEPMPYSVKSDDLGKQFIIVDTTGQTTPEALVEGSVLVTQDKIILKGFKDDPDTTRTISLPTGANFKLNADVIKAWEPKLSYWAIGIGYVIVLLASWIYRFVLAIIYAAIGGIFFFDLVNHSLNYKALLRLSVVAMTPAIILSTVQCYLHYRFPHQSLAYFGLTLFYLLVAILSNRVKTVPRQQRKIEPVDLNPS
jgi:hypothetical protein